MLTIILTLLRAILIPLTIPTAKLQLPLPLTTTPNLSSHLSPPSFLPLSLFQVGR
jgi:hypothetical protein